MHILRRQEYMSAQADRLAENIVYNILTGLNNIIILNYVCET